MKHLTKWVQSVARSMDISPLSEEDAVSAAMFGLSKYIHDFLEGKITKVHKPLLIKYIRTEILNARQRLLTVGRNWFNTVDIHEDNDITQIPDLTIFDPYFQVLRKDVARAVLCSKKLTPKHKALFILLSLGWSWRDSCELCRIFKVNNQGLEQLWDELQDFVRKDLLLLPDNRFYKHRKQKQILITAKHKLQQLEKALYDIHTKLQDDEITILEKQKCKKRLKALYHEVTYTLRKLISVCEEFKNLIPNECTPVVILLTITKAINRIDYILNTCFREKTP